jgi:spoIIIJ-associated protein
METPEEEAKSWLKTVLQLMGTPADVATIPSPTPLTEQPWLEINAADLTERQKALLLRNEGEPLDSLQYLLNTTMHVLDDKKMLFTVELANYRVEHQQKLTDMAWEAAAKVRETQEEFVFGNLNAAERRHIHVLLQEEPDLDTFSRGKEPERRLVVRPKTDEEVPVES